jgi:signal transduction histidine kinase
MDRSTGRYDEKKIVLLQDEIDRLCLSENGLTRFPFEDRQLIMHPFENHVNFRVIRTAIDAIVREKGEETVPVITDGVNKFYDLFAAEHIREILKTMGQGRGFDLMEKMSLSDNKAPFKSHDTEMESLWMSYEAYQMFNWICESVSKDPKFLFNANVLGTEKDKNIKRLAKTGLTPELTYKYGVPRFARKYNNTIFLTPLEVRQGFAVYELRVVDRFIPRSNRENFRRGEEITQGRLAYVPMMFGLAPAEVEPQQMMKDGYDRGIYKLRYEKSIPRKCWDMSVGIIWAATVGQRTILEEQVNVAETEKDKYLDLSRTLEQKVAERTEQNKLLLVELSELDKLRFTQHLLAKARHELNNPLTVLASAIYRIDEAYQKDKKWIPGAEQGLGQDKTLAAKWDQTLGEIEKVYTTMDALRPFALNLDKYRKSIEDVLAGKKANTESLESLSKNLVSLVAGARGLEEQMESSTAAMEDFRILLDSLENRTPAPAGLPGTLEEELTSGLVSVKNEIGNMVGVINTISEFAKVGKYAQGKERVELKSFFEQYANRYRTKFQEGGIEFRVHSEEHAYIKADQTQLLEVFDNLFNNAIEANAKRIEVSIHRKEMPGGVVYNEIKVTDNGKGFSPEDKDNLFLPFSSTKGGKLSGIGLGIVKSIVSTNKGFVDCEGKPGEGASFYITLPPYER